jgi:hypothetical protein
MKVVCVPKSIEAESRLDLNESHLDDIDEVSLGDDVFYKLFNSGIFNKINLVTGSLIDDFEDSNIRGREKIAMVLGSGILNQNFEEVEVASALKEIGSLFQKAWGYNTGIYFFF